jgi:hypothetical protein
MSKTEGEVLYSGATTVPVPDADNNTSAGDAVALSGGDLEPADGDSNERLGVRCEGRQSGDQTTVLLDGVVVAAVATGTGAGVRVDIGNATNSTAGEFEASAGGPGVTLSAEGGTYKGADIPAGYAAVAIA